MKKRAAYLFIGVKGSGKSYYADMVSKTLNAVRKDFKDPLIKMCYTIAGLNPGVPYDEFKTTAFEGTFPTYGHVRLTGRDLLQRVGTDIFRDQVDKNFWVNRLISELGPDQNVAVADCRFANEILCFIDAGFHVRVYLTDYKSERYDATDTHESEKLAQDLLNRYKSGELKTVSFGNDPHIREIITSDLEQYLRNM